MAPTKSTAANAEGALRNTKICWACRPESFQKASTSSSSSFTLEKQPEEHGGMQKDPQGNQLESNGHPGNQRISKEGKGNQRSQWKPELSYNL